MQKLNFKTKNLTDEKIKKLANIFPNVVKEGKVDFEILKQMLSDYLIDGCKERYGLNWVGKKESILKANTPINKTLRPVLEKSIDFENTKNLYIEGDNFEALKIIQESYLNSIKMIYIDPPYNTGKDFIYKDNFTQNKDEYEEEIEAVDEEGVKLYKNTDSNGRFHSDWLSMMYERLLIARDLLKEDGVIFISIDDNEVHNLRHICDEVFGEGNFVAQFVWRKTDNQANIGNIARVKEYILLYTKNISQLKLNKMKLTDRAKKEYRYKDKLGYFRRAILLDKTRGRYSYEVVTPSGKILNGPWMKKKEEFNEMLKNNKIYWTKGGNEQPYGKIYLNESEGQISNDFLGIEFGTNQQGSIEVEKLFKKRYFDFPKPVSLIKHFIIIGTNKNDIILDFFSGSATTANALMELNAEDGGERKFIMVQIPELVDEKSEAYKAGYKTICDIGRERIIRVAKKLRMENEELRIDTGFRYFKVDTSNFKESKDINEINQNNLFEDIDNIKPDRNELDLLFEVVLNLGLKLSLNIKTKEILNKKVYFLEDNLLIACFDKNIDENLAKELAKFKPQKIVLKDNSFASDSDKINFEETIKELSPESDIWVV